MKGPSFFALGNDFHLWIEPHRNGNWMAGVIGHSKTTGGFVRPTVLGAMRCALKFFRENGCR